MAIKVSVGGNTAKAVKVSVASSNPRIVSTVATGSQRVTSANNAAKSKLKFRKFTLEKTRELAQGAS